jgi:hypothetical protein
MEDSKLDGWWLLVNEEVSLGALYPNSCCLTNQTLWNRAASIKCYFHQSNCLMSCSLCGVPGLDIPCSAHTGTGRQTFDDQRSKQVGAAPMTSQDVLDELSSTQHWGSHEIKMQLYIRWGDDQRHKRCRWMFCWEGICVHGSGISVYR